MANGNNNFTTTMKTLIISFGGDGLLYYKIDNRTIPLHVVQGNIFKINERFNSIDNKTDYQIQELQTTDGIRTFRYFVPSKNTYVSRGGGGGGGIKGINVQDEGIQFGGTFITLNFEGANVTVTDDGAGKATVTVGGGGMITGGGTVNRIAMFTGATTIGDSPFLRSGSDVIADGFIYFNSGNGIDVVASGGADILNIGATNADVINYGYAGTTHNMNGTVFNVFTTNLNVTDKIITLNDGGAGGSGGSAGFEIEEAGVATGYFIQNAGRTGFDFKASSNASVVTLSFIGVAGNQTMTVQNASGTIAYLSDIPVNAFVQNGNSFGATARLGTNDAFALEFETNNTLAGTISSAQLWSIGSVAPVAGTRLYIEGTGTTLATFALKIDNDSPTSTLLFYVRDDGHIDAGNLITQSLSIGVSAGFNSLENHFVGVRCGTDITTGIGNTGYGYRCLDHITTSENNTAVGHASLGDLTTGGASLGGHTAMGSSTLRSNTTGRLNCAFGLDAMFTSVSGQDSCAFGYRALYLNTGSYNTSMGWQSLRDSTTADENVAIGYNAGVLSTTANQNTFIGTQSGFSNAGGDRNIYLGYSAGFNQAGSSDLFIVDGRLRASSGEEQTNSLLYGTYASTASGTTAQFLRVNANLGILTNTFGTSADGVLGIANGTAPTTSVANEIQLFSVDSSDALATLGLFLEQTEAVIGVTVPTHKIKVLINGNERYLLISTI